MFASLSSFLPSVLQPSIQSKSLTVNVVRDDRDNDNNDTDDAKSDTMTADDVAVKNKDKRDKNPSETFIFVRPPPSKSNHPLNLQVQMVPPRPSNGAPNTAGSVASRQSVDYSSATTTPTPTSNYPEAPTSANTITHHRTTSYSAETSNLTLTRENSNRSVTSTYSGSTSVASFSSVTSTSSTSSTRRTIIPLYNLQAHNVMTNIIVDAGTDAKIAKFNKRGMELIGLAILEPVEVWAATTSSLTSRATRRDSLLPPGAGGDTSPFLRSKRLSIASRPTTPDMPHTPASSSALSLSSASHTYSPTHPSPTDLAPITETPPPGPARNKRDIFGKLFKKKDATPESAASASATGSLLLQPHQHLQPTHERTLSIPNAASNAASRVTRHFKRASLSTTTAPTASTSSPISIPIPISTPQPPPSLLFDVKSYAPGMPAIDRYNTNVIDPNSTPASPSVSGIINPATSTSTSTSTTAGSATLLRPPVLGIQPTLSSPVIPPVGRPTLYVWVVRRWLKGADNGILGGVMGRLGVGGAGAASGTGIGGQGVVRGMLGGAGGGGGGVDSVEVSFEWKRSRSDKKRKRGKKGARTVSRDVDRERGGLDTGSRRASVVGSVPASASASNVTSSSRGGSPLREAQMLAHQQMQVQVQQKERERLRGHRISVTSQRSGVSAASEERGSVPSPSRRRAGGGGGEDEYDGNGNGNGGGGGGGDGGGDGEDSDPEDSETPWICTLKVRRVAAATPVSPYSDMAPGGGEEPVLRVKVGTLSQTPHHPKVVAMLKVPFPLPDVAVELLAVRRRVVVQGGAVVRAGGEAGAGGAGARDGLILTAEEIKDVVSSTGLWLVVREGFGGVGKVNRKGDGWRIRA